MANSISNSKRKLTRADLIKSPEFWIENIRTELFNMVHDYMDEHQISRKELADKLHVSKGYISQLLNGDSDHRISSLVSIATALGKAPYLYLKDLESVLEADKSGSRLFLDFDELEKKAEQCDFFEHHSYNVHPTDPTLNTIGNINGFSHHNLNFRDKECLPENIAGPIAEMFAKISTNDTKGIIESSNTEMSMANAA